MNYTTTTNSAWFAATAIAAPALTVLALGTNDFGTDGATPAQFAAALQNIITGIRSYAARCAFVILMRDYLVNGASGVFG